MKIDLKDAKKIALEFSKKNKWLIILLLTGIVLILLPEFQKDGDNGKSSGGNANEYWIESYSLEETEKELSKILSAIDGVGNVDVMLTLKTGVERILAQDETQSKYTSGESGNEEVREEKKISIVIVETDGNEETVTIKYIFPEYLGALIVAEGAENASIKLAITQAVTSVTGLPIGNVTVLSMKK